MKLLEINWAPENRQLRQFGIICFVALPVVGWIWGAGLGTMTALGVSGLVLAMLGLTVPRVLKPLFLGLTIVALPIGMLVGELALLFIYFGLFFPLGLLFRIMRRDALQLRMDRTATTYWQPKKKPESVASYYRQS